MIGGKDVFHTHGTRLHAPAQRVAVVTFGERQFTQIDRHAPKRVVDDVDDVADLLGSQSFDGFVAFKLVDLFLTFLDVLPEQFDAFTWVGGQLHACVFDFHDDAVGLRAG